MIWQTILIIVFLILAVLNIILFFKLWEMTNNIHPAQRHIHAPSLKSVDLTPALPSRLDGNLDLNARKSFLPRY